MSGTRHPRGQSKKASAHQRKNKTWKKDSLWKPSERPKVDDAPRQERRSPRTRYR